MACTLEDGHSAPRIFCVASTAASVVHGHFDGLAKRWVQRAKAERRSRAALKKRAHDGRSRWRLGSKVKRRLALVVNGVGVCPCTKQQRGHSLSTLDGGKVQRCEPRVVRDVDLVGVRAAVSEPHCCRAGATHFLFDCAVHGNGACMRLPSKSELRHVRVSSQRHEQTGSIARGDRDARVRTCSSHTRMMINST